MENLAFAVDIGGTSIKLGIVSNTGSILARSSLKTAKDMPLPTLAKNIGLHLREIADTADVKPQSVGICAPGYPDPKTGVLVDGSGAVPSLKTGSISRALSAVLGVPAGIGNDGTCAAQGELQFGVGRTKPSFIYMCIGTGIGGAIVHERRVLEGPNGEPPEFGAICVRPGQGHSSRGLRGSIEDLAGGRALVETYKRKAGWDDDPLDVNTLREMALRDDKIAIEIFEDATDQLAQTIGGLINASCVTECIIGGGLSKAGAFLIDPIQKKVSRYAWKMFADQANIRASELGNDAGLLGTYSIPRHGIEAAA
ncbi:MAG: ROK family protein [Pelagimonas sp.]|uniref:ROK family protein n=1 Tax=Pelagimonas sp. TaxID=2073170 RepID=UPI003D6C66A1